MPAVQLDGLRSTVYTVQLSSRSRIYVDCYPGNTCSQEAGGESILWKQAGGGVGEAGCGRGAA